MKENRAQKEEQPHVALKLCVSGASESGHCGLGAYETAKELGKEIARYESILMTGATAGFPLWAALGAKEEGGTAIGFSPASNENEHVETYGLSLEHLDLIVYTGFGYSGRNVILTRSADAVFIGCGRIGSINEFTIAYEDHKPIGILEGKWTTDETIKHIIERSDLERDNIVIDKDPKKLVRKVTDLVFKEKAAQNRVYQNAQIDSGV